MNYNFKLENEVLTVSLAGRLDTDAAAAFETELSSKCKEYPHGSLVFDASELQYVASSGLRIMLKMAKTEKNFRIENLIPAVYSVFEMTGFSKIMNITKALRKIDLSKCEKIGSGGNGAVYRVSEDEIVKVNYEDGCKVYFEDGFVICRFSGTEPLLRIFAESTNPVRAKEYIETFKKFLFD